MTTAAKRTIDDVFKWVNRSAQAVAVYFLIALVNEVKDMHRDVETSNRKNEVQDVIIKGHGELLRTYGYRLDRIQNVSTIN